MKKKVLLCLLPILSCLAGCNSTPQSDDFADRVIYGNIITMDSENPTAEAVAVKDGKIIAVGSKESMAEFIGGRTATDNYENDYIYPGFIDAHSHYGVMSNIMTGGVIIEREKSGEDGYELGDYAAYAREIYKYVQANPDKEVYQAYGMWTKTLKGGILPPTATILDDYCPTDKPVVVVGAGGHDCWLNTAAIKKYIGNYEGTDDEKSEVDNWINQVGKDCVEYIDIPDNHMRPYGYFTETARFRITDNLPHTVNEIKDFVLDLQDETLCKGYTTVGDCTVVESATNKQVTAFKELNDEGKLKMKFRSYYEIREYDSAETREQQLNYAIQLASETKDNEYFQVVGIKVFLDGVYEALTAYTSSAYTRDAGKRDGYKGIQRWYGTLNDDLKELVYNANKAGLAMEFHAMGDAAVSQALDACEYANNKLVEDGKEAFTKNAISHLGYVADSDISRFASLGVTAVVAPEWAGTIESIYPFEVKALGSTKAEDMYKIKSFMNVGANVAFHTDGAVLGGVPEMIYDATTRKDVNHEVDHVRGEAEILTGLESLECLTINAAHPLNSDFTTGIIKVGDAADFTIYDKDYRDNAVATNLETYQSAHLLALYSNGKDMLKTLN